jgi:hypothetical protein
MRTFALFSAQFAALAAISLSPNLARAAPTMDPKTPKPLDGVMIEAVEVYASPKSSSLDIGVGVYPFNSYYTDLSLNFGYTYRFNQNWGWDVLGLSYFVSFQKDLTSQLADKYAVKPESIEKLQYIFATNAVFTHTYGKFLFMEDYIRYFRSSIFAGPAMVNTNELSAVAVNFGARFELFHGEYFSWTFEFRDALTIYGTGYVTFTFGSGLNF